MLRIHMLMLIYCNTLYYGMRCMLSCITNALTNIIMLRCNIYV
ncbi:hypothetical protein [Klebsiella phage 05F01]|nr:hypothetical protein [Klebsiella phage 05F01]